MDDKIILERFLNCFDEINEDMLRNGFSWINSKLAKEIFLFWRVHKMVKDNKVIKKDKEIKLIFLDIDGVLNYKGSEDIATSCLNNLKEIVKKSKARIILISSWKSGWFKKEKDKQDDYGNYLDERLASVNLKIDNKSSRHVSCRYYEVLDYLLKYNTSKFVILDDDGFNYKNTILESHLIETNNINGLTSKLASKAISILNVTY